LTVLTLQYRPFRKIESEEPGLSDDWLDNLEEVEKSETESSHRLPDNLVSIRSQKDNNPI